MSTVRRPLSGRRTLLLMVACLALGMAGRWWWLTSHPVVIQGRLIEGTEVQMVLIASASCHVCTSAEFKEVASTALEHLQARSWPTKHRFASVFVGLGIDTDALLNLARRFGRYDELVLGHGWANLGAMRYVWRDIPAEGATPQVVVTRRELSTNEHTRRIAPAEETLLLRLIGLDDIKRWAFLGYPIPDIDG